MKKEQITIGDVISPNIKKMLFEKAKEAMI